MKLPLLSLTCNDRFMLGTVRRTVAADDKGMGSVGDEVVEDSEDNIAAIKQRKTNNLGEKEKLKDVSLYNSSDTIIDFEILCVKPYFLPTTKRGLN
jgi:hypothetical protein